MFENNSRAQTSIDLAIALGILFAGLSVALTVVGPFFSGTAIDEADTTVDAQIVAEHIVEKLSYTDGEITTDSELDPEKSVDFFPQTSSESDESLHDATDIPINENTGVRVFVTSIDNSGRGENPESFNEIFGGPTGEIVYGPAPQTSITTEYTIQTRLDGVVIEIRVVTWNEVRS